MVKLNLFAEPVLLFESVCSQVLELRMLQGNAAFPILVLHKLSNIT